jgi:hypothetical protein
MAKLGNAFGVERVCDDILTVKRQTENEVIGSDRVGAPIGSSMGLSLILIPQGCAAPCWPHLGAGTVGKSSSMRAPWPKKIR